MKGRIKVGELNRRVEIQKPELVQDQYDEWVEDWATWKKKWAAIRPASGREFWGSEKFGSEATGEIIIRYDPDVDPKMRVKYKDRMFYITAIIHPKEARDRTVLIVREVLGDEQQV